MFLASIRHLYAQKQGRDLSGTIKPQKDGNVVFKTQTLEIKVLNFQYQQAKEPKDPLKDTTNTKS